MSAYLFHLIPMLRLTDIQLPLDHSEAAIRLAVLNKLNIVDEELLRVEIFRRSVDARKKSAINLIYTLDIVTTKNEQLLEQFYADKNVTRTPDCTYKFVAKAN